MGNYYGRQGTDYDCESDLSPQTTAVLKNSSQKTKTTKKEKSSKLKSSLAEEADFSESQFNLVGLEKNRRKSWSSQSVRLNHISKSNPNIHVSTSFNRSLSTGNGEVGKKTTEARSIWPITQTEEIFLPYFKIYERPLEKEFQVNHLIDGGAFGKVFQVEDKLTADKYALKVLSKSKLINSGSVKQIRNEVEIQSLCSHHPFIVECVSYWQNRTKIFILLELVTGGELLDTIKSFTLDLIRIYVAEIAIALDFLQNAGIIYRDLKPENILLDNDYHIKLTDFGLSKWLKIGERTRTICGTAEYMAPEIITGESYGHAADWWSLGVIVHLMFTRKFPVWSDKTILLTSLNLNGDFKEATKSSSNGQVQSVKRVALPENLGNIPEAGKDLLRRLFERNPRYRLKSVLELQRIAIFKGFSFDDCEKKKMQPKLLIKVPKFM